MLKGINKRILEVRLPDSPYFEKAVVFLRSDSLQVSSDISAMAEENILSLEESFRPADRKINACIIAGRVFSVIFRISVIVCAAAALRIMLQ